MINLANTSTNYIETQLNHEHWIPGTETTILIVKSTAERQIKFGYRSQIEFWLSKPAEACTAWNLLHTMFRHRILQLGSQLETLMQLASSKTAEMDNNEPRYLKSSF